jgi:hypothetical protein
MAGFLEFLQTCKPDLYDPTYFDQQGPLLYGPEVFKALAVFLAQSRTGRIISKIKVRSLMDFMGSLFGTIRRKRKCAIEQHLRDNIMNFINGELKDQEGLTTAMHVKALAMPDDTSTVFANLYAPAYLATFMSMRDVLNLTLYINLMIDTASRGSDLLYRS